jgi:cyanophycinase-like exopeptidase
MIAITGSGEFLPSILDVDKVLISYLDDTPKVLTFSTAAGKESDNRLHYWKNLAQEHFAKLGIDHKHIDARNREDLNKSTVIDAMRTSNFVYFSGGSPIHLYDSIYNSEFSVELENIENRGIIAGCSAGAMIMGEKMIKGTGLNYLKNTIVVPHYGESFYSWISNTVKVLNRGKYKLLCLEKDTYFIKDKNEITVIGKQQVHIIYKNEHHTFSDGDKIDLSLLL